MRLFKLRVEPPLLACLAMLLDQSGLVLNAVIDFLAQRTFPVPSAFSDTVTIELIERLQRPANDAVFEALSVPQVVVMENLEGAFLDFLSIFYQVIIVNLNRLTGGVFIAASSAGNGKIGAKIILALENKVRAVLIEALKTP